MTRIFGLIANMMKLAPRLSGRLAAADWIRTNTFQRFRATGSDLLVVATNFQLVSH